MTSIDFQRFYPSTDAYNKFNGLNCGLCDGPLVAVLYNANMDYTTCKTCALRIQFYTDQYGCTGIDSVYLGNFAFYRLGSGIQVSSLTGPDVSYKPLQSSALLSLIEMKEAIRSGRLDKLCGIVTTKNDVINVTNVPMAA